MDLKEHPWDVLGLWGDYGAFGTFSNFGTFWSEPADIVVLSVSLSFRRIQLAIQADLLTSEDLPEFTFLEAPDLIGD